MKDLDILKTPIDQKLGLLQNAGLLSISTSSLLYKEFSTANIKYCSDESKSIIGRKSFAPGELSETSSLEEEKEYYYAEFRFRITGTDNILKEMALLPAFIENDIHLFCEGETRYYSYSYYAENDFIADVNTLLDIEEKTCSRKVILFEHIISYNLKINELNCRLRDYLDKSVSFLIESEKRYRH